MLCINLSVSKVTQQAINTCNSKYAGKKNAFHNYKWNIQASLYYKLPWTVRTLGIY